MKNSGYNCRTGDSPGVWVMLGLTAGPPEWEIVIPVVRLATGETSAAIKKIASTARITVPKMFVPNRRF